MSRNIHDIFDVIMKLVLLMWGDSFLNYVGIDEQIGQYLGVEYIAGTGKKAYLDALVKLKNQKLFHMEFQYPEMGFNDNDRFFNYNITAQYWYQDIVDTLVFNFTRSKNKDYSKRIGDTKYFCPMMFYLGDVDFKKQLKKINIKLNSNKKLTAFDELTLILMPLNYEFKDKLKIFSYVLETIKNKNLFDESRYDFIQTIVDMEIRNLLSEKEIKKLVGGVDVTPEALEVVTNVIGEVNRKVIGESRQEGWDEGHDKGFSEGHDKGFSEGHDDGFSEGHDQAMKSVAKSLKDSVDIELLAEKTGLSIEEIQKL